MQIIHRIGFYLCFGLLLSCRIALPPQKQVEHLKALPKMGQEIQAQKRTKTFKKGVWPSRYWWLAYGSSELNELMLQSLLNNPSIQEVKSRLEVAKQEALIERSRLYPLVFFDFRENKQYLSKNGLYRALNHNIPLDADLIDLSLSFRYEFDFWGKYRNLFYAAIGRAKAQRAEVAEIQLITTTALAQAYFAYKVNLIKKQFYQELVGVRKNILALQNSLVKNALADDLPSYSAAENLIEAQQLLAGIDNEISQNRHLLNILAGRSPEMPLSQSKKLPGLPRQLIIPGSISLDLLARRPDLMAQIWRAKALAYQTGAAMAEYYPDVNLVGLLGLESTGWKKLLRASSFTAAIRPAVHLPIFTAGAIRANIRATKAEFDEAIFAYNSLLLSSTQEVLDVLQFAKTVYAQKQEQERILKLVSDRYRIVQRRERDGLDNGMAVYREQEELIQRKLVNLNLLYNQYLASVKLTKALGGGYCQADIPLLRQS
ncbi:efflux transporter outer membrane subunit [Legionella jordanis]|uniref:Outer membrane efflux lipoprotein n=1 Tax=Legionella jordanis TaxID=456 RepID=A0A0W0VBH0_9GAMM|nr:efflux transporter outer membrane subunit [Legionella jordanis]KTD17476.1 outer membrane efflux lipoprotein [Legionella jordanis]RMX05184.1 efflux transporter outer membrane subunit [Legionella jordanis]RMX17440.1 efflux transporter outer membrane subunit [Legionella jordanis]VEH13445.1 outer membrane efflux lipoprotein [Legionella jordanis]HAT8714364.1 efflux transporter outer membrane subunit [Legionella jordanis]